MVSFIQENYVWFKSLHVIAVIAWMAGLLYLPRLFVYHADAAPGSELSETLKIMERRLLRAIMNPAMMAVYLFGGLMVWSLGEAIWAQPWWHIKATCIVLLTWLHHVFGKWRKDFEKDQNTRPAKIYRIANEGPTLLMIIIVIMVIAQPL